MLLLSSFEMYDMLDVSRLLLFVVHLCLMILHLMKKYKSPFSNLEKVALYWCQNSSFLTKFHFSILSPHIFV